MWLSSSLRPALLLLMGLALASCAFQPLYGTRGSQGATAQATSQVEISTPDNRLGQLVRNELAFLMGESSGAARYHLDVELSPGEVALFANTTGRVTSYSYRLTGNWRLRDSESGEILTHGRSQAAASYNQTDQPFANIRAKRDAEERTARQVAEDISTRVSAHIATAGNTSASADR